jgi:hypothetical protein
MRLVMHVFPPSPLGTSECLVNQKVELWVAPTSYIMVAATQYD